MKPDEYRRLYEESKALIEADYRRKLDALNILFPEFHEDQPKKSTAWKAERTRKNEVANPIPREMLEKLYVDQGKTIDEVAEEIGFSSSRVRQMLFNENIPIRPRGQAGRAMIKAQKKIAEDRDANRQQPNF